MIDASHDSANRSNVGTADETAFARLVALACHDLRTPLATVFGFARTLARTELPSPADRYVEMIELAAGQLTDLLDELGLAARIEGGRYEPALAEEDSLELVRRAAARLGDERVDIEGSGATVRVDPAATERALAALTRCAARHGGFERVTVTVEGPVLHVSPITAASAPVVLGEDLRDLGAAVAVKFLEATGGSVAVEGERLRVELPA